MSGLTDLPVSVEAGHPLAAELTAFVETEAGWQIVPPDGPPTPVLLLSARAAGDRPCLVVLPEPVAADRVRDELLAGAIDVVAWPSDRARLLDAPRRVGRSDEAAGPRLVRVAGLCGGVGTSTVTLALAGLLAWSGRETVAAGGDDLVRLCASPPWQGPGTTELAGLSPGDRVAEVHALAAAVAGVPRLRLVGGGGRGVTDTAGWPGDVVVADVGVLRPGDEPDLVVARLGAGLRGAGVPASVTVLCVAERPEAARALRRVLGPVRIGWLPWSARVERAGIRGRVPSGLPGTWLGALRRAVAGGSR